MMTGIDDRLDAEQTHMGHCFIGEAPIVSPALRLDSMPAPWIPKRPQSGFGHELQVPTVTFNVASQLSHVDAVVIA